MNYLQAAIFLQAEGATEPVGVPGWVPLVIGLILLLVFLWGLYRNSIPQGEPAHAGDVHHAPQMAAVSEPGRSTGRSPSCAR